MFQLGGKSYTLAEGHVVKSAEILVSQACASKRSAPALLLCRQGAGCTAQTKAFESPKLPDTLLFWYFTSVRHPVKFLSTGLH